MPTALPSSAILIVDDDRLMADHTAAICREAGYACDTAHSLTEALAMAGCRRYHAVVLDYHLPDGTGDLFLRWPGLRRRPIPVFFVTAAGEAVASRLRFDPAVRHVFHKPLDGAALTQALMTMGRTSTFTPWMPLISPDERRLLTASPTP